MKKFIKKAHKKAHQKGEALVEAARQSQQPAEPPKTVPRITNKTVEEHRDEVLSSAKKYIYPLQHSKHKIVLISVSIFIATLIAFFTYCTLALYKFQGSSTFLYKVTQVIPFPVARIGGDFVAYENYLFELRRYMHYYETQQQLDLNSESGQQQLDDFKKRALEKVINFAYIKELAKQNNITVSDQEVETQIELLRTQNRLGSGDKVFEEVLKDYFGWSRADFKRYLEQEMLTQKVIAALDTQTQDQAVQAELQLQQGADFAAVAKEFSDDLTSKDNGGDMGFWIDKTNRDLAPQATDVLFTMQPGQVSPIINTGYSLEIFKLLEKKDDKVRAARILFNFNDISSYINDLKEQQPARAYITTQ
ncbi:peptidylprolyl isomerase [Candidatus Saccharibacteria bacterium]|nr:peptidylprolyl isomerase [Candidatus Saccharibacteria bacterium]